MDYSGLIMRSIFNVYVHLFYVVDKLCGNPHVHSAESFPFCESTVLFLTDVVGVTYKLHFLIHKLLSAAGYKTVAVHIV